ncbi:helix-turn-helix domain-containing protein [Helicobacter sp. UBA3407]|uniref:winged helix-turn-helix transcriptional regulator n=1 Tax=Helicobacter sp. UBA3407 TaxID=1946588 RepID=UPI002607B267|nr:helix-turn-helix domain-containing protein [Helicobacter sp. UBA3407]
MYKPKLEKDKRCPLEYGMELFGGKWKSRIICVLNEKKILRYSELRTEMVNVTDAVLATALKELIHNQIIQRVQYDEIPPRVEYSLTQKGQSVIPILQGICNWAGLYYQEESDKALKQCQKCNFRIP